MKNSFHVLIILISILCLSTLTGCTEAQELHEHAYVIAMGIDRSKENPDHIRVTFEFVIPIAFNAESNNQVSSITTIEATTLHSAISLANTYISKELNLSHNKILVFSEELAYEGLDKYISTISNDKNYRTNMYIAISKCSAEEYIKNTNPQLEKNPAKFYELIFNGYDYTSLLANSYFLGYILSTNSPQAQATSILTSINIESDKSTNQQKQTHEMYGPYDSNITAGEVPKTGGTKTDALGMAVFRGSQLVGEMTGEETMYFLMANDKFREVYFSIYDPFMPDNIITFKLNKKRNANRSVTFVDNIPLIHLDVHLQANIISVNKNIDYKNDETLEGTKNHLEYIITRNLKSFLYTTTDSFGSDICGFGKLAAKNYLTLDKWYETSWLEMYRYAYFDVNVNVDIEKSGLVFTQ